MQFCRNDIFLSAIFAIIIITIVENSIFVKAQCGFRWRSKCPGKRSMVSLNDLNNYQNNYKIEQISCDYRGAITSVIMPNYTIFY